MTKKKKITISVLSLLALAALIVWVAWSNTALELTSYNISSDELPKSFEGFRIAQVSDLHNTEMGDDNETLITMLKEAVPSLIVITGDLIDSRNTDIETALKFAEDAMEIAPCYYVTGNHEARVEAYADLKEALLELGVVVLEDNRVTLERSGEAITLIGVDDPSFQTDYLFGDDEAVMKSKLDKLKNEEDGYTILLSHRPELFDIYAENGLDLVLCGHAHGGQFRLPLIGGIAAPNQGLFPKYDAGIYTKASTTMVVSRGIGNSIIPLRFNNRPEVILIELTTPQ